MVVPGLLPLLSACFVCNENDERLGHVHMSMGLLDKVVMLVVEVGSVGMNCQETGSGPAYQI